MSLGEFFNSFKSLWVGAAVAASAGPLGLWAIDLEPPWPAGAGKVASLFCAVALLLAFLISRSIGTGDSRRGGRRRATGTSRSRYVAIAILCLGLGGVISYLWAYGRYVVTDSIERGGRTEIIRIVVGSKLRPDLDASATTRLDLLRDNLYDPEAVWTSESVSNARLALLTLFVLSFSLLTAGAALLAPSLRKSRGDTPCDSAS